MAELVAQSGSTLTSTPGIGAVTAARLLGRTGRASRFPSSAAFASYTGIAPAGPPGALHRWIRSSGGQWVGVVTFAISMTDGTTYKAVEQLVPAEALRPR